MTTKLMPGRLPDSALMHFGEWCPKYENCNAAFCPALGGAHRQGERVCFWMREAVKAGGEERIRGRLREELAEVVVQVAHKATSEEGYLGSALREASLSGSKIESGKQLRPR